MLSVLLRGVRRALCGQGAGRDRGPGVADRPGRGARRARVAAAATLVAVAGVALAPRAARATTKPLAPAEIPATAQKVTVGIHVVTVHNVDMPGNTFYMDAYLWFQWRGELDPIASLELMNAVDRWGMTIKADHEEGPKQQPDGSLYQVLRVEGRFFHPFSFERYPLDVQQLGLVLESSLHTLDQLVYVPAAEGSGLSDDVYVPGWSLGPLQHELRARSYDTRFGDVAHTGPRTTFGSTRFFFSLERPATFFVFKLLLPLLVVMISSIATFSLHASYVDARIAIPITALLTAVFLQQSYSANLPEISYMVLMDEIYALAYVVISAAFVVTLVTANWARAETEEAFERVRRLDARFLPAQLVVFGVGVVLLAVFG